MFSGITNLFSKDSDKTLAYPDTGDNDCSRSMTTTDRSPADKSDHPQSPLAPPTPKTLQPSDLEVNKQVSSTTSSKRDSGASVYSGTDEQASSSRFQGDRSGLLGLLDYPAPSGPAPTNFPGATDRGRAHYRVGEGSNLTCFPGATDRGRANHRVGEGSNVLFQNGHMGNNQSPQKPKYIAGNSKYADNDGAWRSKTTANTSQGRLGEGSMRASSESAWRAPPRSSQSQSQPLSHSASPGPVFHRQSSRPRLQSQSSILGDERNSARSERSMGVGLLGDAPTPESQRSSGRFHVSPNRPISSRTNTGNSVLGAPSPSTSPSMPPRGRPGGSVSDLTNRSELSQSRSAASDPSPRDSQTESILGEPPAHLSPLGLNPPPSRSRIGSYEHRKSFPSLESNFGGRFSHGNAPFGACPGAPPNSVASFSAILPHKNRSNSSLPHKNRSNSSLPHNNRSYSSLPNNNRSYSSLPNNNRSYSNLPQSRSVSSLNLNFKGRFSRNSASSSRFSGETGSPQPHSFRHSSSSENGRVLNFDGSRRSYNVLQSPTSVGSMPVLREGTPLHNCGSGRERSAESPSRSGPVGPDSTIGFRMQRTNECLIEMIA